MKPREGEIQQRYYTQTANRYEGLLDEHKEHNLALAFLIGVIDCLKIESVLDIGSGTGRAIAYIKQKREDLRVVGIEPVAAMRAVGYQKGILESELIEGDAMAMDFSDAEFDLVCEFGSCTMSSTLALPSRKCYASPRRQSSFLTATTLVKVLS